MEPTSAATLQKTPLVIAIIRLTERYRAQRNIVGYQTPNPCADDELGAAAQFAYWQLVYAPVGDGPWLELNGDRALQERVHALLRDKVEPPSIASTGVGEDGG